MHGDEPLKLLTTTDGYLAAAVYTALRERVYSWLEIELTGRAGVFDITAKSSLGKEELQPGPRAFDLSLEKARAFVHGMCIGARLPLPTRDQKE